MPETEQNRRKDGSLGEKGINSTVKAAAGAAGGTSKYREDNDDEIDDPNAPLPDADWDSDAEEAGGGEWVKGEWHPIRKKKEQWYVCRFIACPLATGTTVYLGLG